MKTKILIMTALLPVFIGCTVVKVLQPTGGSRADGIIEMSYQYSWLDTVEVDWASALQTAKQRCQAWGYDSAEPFGQATSVCQSGENSFCSDNLVTVKYQCIGNLEKGEGDRTL
ncbi:MAG TPA: YecR family lipoprotein [Candidatus Omnitrophota bacterium]|nr:YecR family lipoprotein [Candidatus Omnitrophota bacterium]